MNERASERARERERDRDLCPSIFEGTHKFS